MTEKINPGCVQSFPNKEKMKMNVYDFDNTIYDGESFIDLFIFLFKKDPSLVKYVPDVINGLYKYTKGTINAEEALEQYSTYVRSLAIVRQIMPNFKGAYIMMNNGNL